jgi:hypothetical protein
MRRLLPLLALCTLVAPALAQTVIVKSTRDPVDKSYRKMVKGMERFEREHALAPQAALRFRLLPRLPNADMTGITLRIAGDTTSQPLPIAPDNSFALVRNEQLLREDAAVLANRRTASMTWRASIVSPGLPAGTRRLGDLRLECKVGMDAGLISNTSPMFAWLSDALTNTDAVCGQPDGNYVFFAERPIFGVTLRAGERTQVPSGCCMPVAANRPTSCPIAIARSCSTAPTMRRSGTPAGRTTRWSSSTTCRTQHHETDPSLPVRCLDGWLRQRPAADRHVDSGCPAGCSHRAGPDHARPDGGRAGAHQIRPFRFRL